MPLMCQLPEPSAAVVPTTLAPLYSVTVLSASAVPTMLIETALSCAGAVVLMTGAAMASKVSSDTTKFPLGYCPPGPPPGSDGFLIASRNMPVIGDAESTNAVMVYVSVPSELLLVLANNSPGDSRENVVPLSEETLRIETGVCGLDNVGDAAVV